MSRRFWLLVIGLFAIGLTLMLPNIRHSYLGLWLAGECGQASQPELCIEPGGTEVSSLAPGSFR